MKAQLWAVIGLLIAILAGNLFCNLRHRGTAQKTADAPDFRDLYQLNKLDELISAAREQLQSRPNSTDALYYGALALMAQRRYPEAHAYFQQLVELDPSMRETLRADLEETSRDPST